MICWEILARMAVKRDWRVGAEIGVNKGETLFPLMDEILDLKMYAVDSWVQPSHPGTPQIGKEFMEAAKKYGDRLTILHGTSVDMAQRGHANELDFIFIDADHSYESVLEDINHWSWRVRRNGIVMGHDIHMDGVKKAVDKIYGSNYYKLGCNIWAAEC